MKPMTLPLARILLALLFLVAGLLCWTAAGAADELATRHERIATLRGLESTTQSWWQTLVEDLFEPDSTNQTFGGRGDSRTAPTASRLSMDYWAGRYDTVTSDNDANSGDSALLLIAANAFFRKAQREANGRPPSVEQLDQATHAYAGVLKNGGSNSDAAYNFEYVARLRDSVAKSKGAPSRQTQAPTARRDDDLPSGPTIHGRPGTHPPNTRGEEFEVLTPMDYGDREAQPEATPGRALPRKG